MAHFGHLHDDSIYFVCAKSLAEGSGYRILSLPDRPYQTKYPPLWPALLACIWKANPRFPENLKWALGAVWLLLPAYLAIAARWFRQAGMKDPDRVLACALIATSPCVVFFSTSLMSELLFSCFLVAALMSAERAETSSGSDWAALCAGLLTAAAYLTKTAALPLLVTAPLILWLRGRPRRALVFTAAMAPVVLLWTGWVHFHRTASVDLVSLYYTDYLGFQFYNVGLRDLPILVWRNLDGVLAGISGLLIFDISKTAWGLHLARWIAIGAVLGTIRVARRSGITQFHAFAAVYTGVLLLWHYPPNERFMLPVFPLLLNGLISEIRLLAGLIGKAMAGVRRSEKIVAGAAGLVLAGLAILGVVFNFQALSSTFPGILKQHRAVLASNRVAFDWIAQHTPQGTFFAYDDPVFYLYTGRPATSFPVAPMPFYYQDRDRILQPFRSMSSFARQQRLDYLFLTAADFHRELGENEKLAAKEILVHDPAFRPVYQGQLTAIYELQSQPVTVTRGASAPVDRPSDSQARY